MALFWCSFWSCPLPLPSVGQVTEVFRSYMGPRGREQTRDHVVQCSGCWTEKKWPWILACAIVPKGMIAPFLHCISSIFSSGSASKGALAKGVNRHLGKNRLSLTIYSQLIHPLTTLLKTIFSQNRGLWSWGNTKGISSFNGFVTLILDHTVFQM